MSKVQVLGRKARERGKARRFWDLGHQQDMHIQGLFPESTPEPFSQVTPVTFLLRCSSGHGRYFLTHAWLRVPMTYANGLPRRNEDGGLPNGGQGTGSCPRPCQNLLLSLRKILRLLLHCSPAPFLRQLYLKKAPALPEHRLRTPAGSIRMIFSQELLGLQSSFQSFPNLGKEEPVPR